MPRRWIFTYPRSLYQKVLAILDFWASHASPFRCFRCDGTSSGRNKWQDFIARSSRTSRAHHKRSLLRIGQLWSYQDDPAYKRRPTKKLNSRRHSNKCRRLCRANKRLCVTVESFISTFQDYLRYCRVGNYVSKFQEATQELIYPANLVADPWNRVVRLCLQASGNGALKRQHYSAIKRHSFMTDLR